MTRRLFDLFYRLEPGELEDASVVIEQDGARFVPLCVAAAEPEPVLGMFQRRWEHRHDKHGVALDYVARLGEADDWRPFHLYSPAEEGQRSWWSALWLAAAVCHSASARRMEQISSYDQVWRLDGAHVVKTDRGLDRSAPSDLSSFVARGSQGPDAPNLTPAMKERFRARVLPHLQEVSRRFEAQPLVREIVEATRDAIAFHLVLFAENHDAITGRLQRGRDELREELRRKFVPLRAELLLGLDDEDATEERVLAEVRRRYPDFGGLPDLGPKSLIDERLVPVGIAGSPAVLSRHSPSSGWVYIHPLDELSVEPPPVRTPVPTYPPIDLSGDVPLTLEPFPLADAFYLYEDWHDLMATVERYRWGPRDPAELPDWERLGQALLRECANLRDGWTRDPVVTRVEPDRWERFVRDLDKALFDPAYGTLAASYKEEVLGFIFGELELRDFIVFAGTKENSFFIGDWFDYLWVMFHPRARVAVVLMATSTD